MPSQGHRKQAVVPVWDAAEVVGVLVTSSRGEKSREGLGRWVNVGRGGRVQRAEVETYHRAKTPWGTPL